MSNKWQMRIAVSFLIAGLIGMLISLAINVAVFVGGEGTPDCVTQACPQVTPFPSNK